MAAASPRCIQQLAPTHDHPPPHKSSPTSCTTAPSLQSELNLDPCILTNPSRPLPISPNASPSYPIRPSSPASTVSSPQTWVSALLSTKFYGPCPHHANLRKNDLNLFCTNHAVKICQYCHQANHHRSSPTSPACTVLHVSRYMYHDVLLAKEAASQLDVSDVQSYLNNGNRVVYIDRRAQTKSKLAPHAKSCAVCSRTLQDPYRFCSLFCRLAHAKDPAAVASVPVPDALPLLQPAVRKVKKSVSESQSPSKRMERFVKRFDRSTSSAVTQSVSQTPSPSVKMECASTPPLQLVTMKKNRRKGQPYRSPLSTRTSILLFHSLNALCS